MYGQHQRSFSHSPQAQLPLSTTGSGSDGIKQPRESSQSPHHGSGSMIDNLLRRMRDAAGITNAAGIPVVQGGGRNPAEESLLQQQYMMMASGVQRQQMLEMMAGYGGYPNMMNGMGNMYQQQYPGMMNSAMNYMNPYTPQQQLLYNQATTGLYGQNRSEIYDNMMYGNNMYGNSMMAPYGYMGMSGPSYYQATDPYSYGHGAQSGFGMGYMPYNFYSKQIYYPERTSSVKSLWARDYY